MPANYVENTVGASIDSRCYVERWPTTSIVASKPYVDANQLWQRSIVTPVSYPLPAIDARGLPVLDLQTRNPLQQGFACCARRPSQRGTHRLTLIVDLEIWRLRGGER